MASEKRVALVTGANRGIGFETARQLGAKGITVILAARGLDDAQQAAQKLKAEGIDAHGIQLDITKPEQQAEAAKYIEQKFGKLDILVNNAGVISEENGVFLNGDSASSEEELKRIFDTNFFASIRVTHELLPLLKKSDAGRIVNLSSILGSLTLHSDPKSPLADFKKFAYNSSKTALNAFTVHLADELKGTSIKVNSVHPGWVKTKMGGDGAQVEVADGAKASVEAALFGPSGPNGRFLQEGSKELPW